jgi:DNA repair exonuclease SbcCD ATPase subunit
MDTADAERRRLDQQRGDLAGRIKRRRGLPAGGGECETCGAPLDPARTDREIATWTAELAQLDDRLSGVNGWLSELRAELTRHAKAESDGREWSSRLGRLAEVEAAIAKRQEEHDTAERDEAAAFASVKELAAAVEGASLRGEPAEAVTSVQRAVTAMRQNLAEKAGREGAQRQALEDLLDRFDDRAQSLSRRRTDLEREQTEAGKEAEEQQVLATQAARFRGMAAGFDRFQVNVRAGTATALAADTLAIHRQLSERDEFESLTIDPADYAVQVVPRDLGEEVPAAVYEGGGHRLLLGLAFRLAVARLVACPFLLLDEPTYGLDEAHRSALLHRVAGLDVSKQILLVTHQAMGDVPGTRVRVERQGRESVVEQTGD